MRSISKKKPAKLNDKYDELSIIHSIEKLTIGTKNPEKDKTELVLHPSLQGLKYQQIPGDGHCLFHAVGLHVGQTAESLRQAVAAHLEDNFNQYEPHYASSNNRDFRQHIEDIRTSNEWGDHLEIQAIQCITNRPIIIIRTSENPTIPDDLNEYTLSPIFVYYNGQSHYDAFILLDGSDARTILTEIRAEIAQGRKVTYTPDVESILDNPDKSETIIVRESTPEDKDIVSEITRGVANMQLPKEEDQEMVLHRQSSMTQFSGFIDRAKKIKNLNMYMPRCEFRARYQNTTIFKMDDPEFWGAYYRSQKSRSFKMLGKKMGLHTSPGINKIEGDSAYAHTGGHASPLKSPEYLALFKENNVLTPHDNKELRDEILTYKTHLCDIIKTAFEKKMDNEQPARVHRARSAKEKRPIVFIENSYPCILVRMPIFNMDFQNQAQDAATEYWSEHPVPMQRLIVCCFVAITNTLAEKKNIPIEMVMRAGFGHHLPSVDETKDTFRINVGLIPEVYAKLIGEALVVLTELMNDLKDEDSKTFNVSKTLQRETEKYNATKNSQVKFSGSIWQIIRQPAHGGLKSLLSELLERNQFSAELFTDYLMGALAEHSEKISQEIVENALEKMISHITYGKTVSMKSTADLVSLKKRTWPAEVKNVSKDAAFDLILRKLCASLQAEPPSKGELLGLYSYLEFANVNFIKNFCNKSAEDGYGSDSDFEYDEPEHNKIYGRKIRLQNGMKAISVSFFAAQYYLKCKKIKNFTVNTEYMYYETADAIELGEILPSLTKEKNYSFKEYDKEKNKILKASELPTEELILFYDLNHFNKHNKLDGSKPLASRLQVEPALVVLDYTSATYEQIREAISLCLEKNDTVLLVGSGIKHDQGGADFNPYGELRIISKDKKMLIKIYDKVIATLNGKNNEYAVHNSVPGTAHTLVRAYKARGHAVTFSSLYPVQQSAQRNIIQPSTPSTSGDTSAKTPDKPKQPPRK